jgi:hypothetical protein
MDSNRNVSAIFVTPFDYCLVGAPFEPRIGNRLRLELKKLITTGQTIKLTGKLPTGLKFAADTGLLSGTLSGKPGIYTISVQILNGKTVVRTVSLPIKVLDFPSSLNGSYDALLEGEGGEPVGAFHLTIANSNTWSATLDSAGAAKRSAKGAFVLGEGVPTALVTAVFAASTGAPQVTVQVTIDGETPDFTGSHDHGSIRGFRLASGNALPPSTVACNLVLYAGIQDGIVNPAGIGWLKGTVAKTGTGDFKGMLGDGTAAVVSLRVSPSGQAVLWAQPYANKNSLIAGIVTLGDLGQPSTDDGILEDGCRWRKQADPKSLSYPKGFDGLRVSVGSSRWSASATASALGASLGWRGGRTADVMIEGAGLSNQKTQSTNAKLPTEFTLDDKFNLATSAPDVTTRVLWSGKVTAKDGGFAGVLTIPLGFSGDVGSGAAAASGVLMQDPPMEFVTGCGLVKVPVVGGKGVFRTAALVLKP